MLEQEAPLSFMSSYNVLLQNEGYNLAMFGIIVTSLNRTINIQYNSCYNFQDDCCYYCGATKVRLAELLARRRASSTLTCTPVPPQTPTLVS